MYFIVVMSIHVCSGRQYLNLLLGGLKEPFFREKSELRHYLDLDLDRQKQADTQTRPEVKQTTGQQGQIK